MRVHAFIPVKEALHIDRLPDFQVLHCRIHIRRAVAEVGLDHKRIRLAVLRDVEVQIVALAAGAVPVVKERHIISGIVLSGRLNSQALECHELVLMVDELVRSKKLCRIKRLCKERIAVLNELKGAIHDLHFAGPLCLIAVHADLRSGNQLLIVLLGAGHIVHKIRAVLILGVKRSLVLPPGLLCLYIRLDHHVGIQLCRHVLFIGHHLCRISSLCLLFGAFRFRSRRGFLRRRFFCCRRLHSSRRSLCLPCSGTARNG